MIVYLFVIVAKEDVQDARYTRSDFCGLLKVGILPK